MNSDKARRERKPMGVLSPPQRTPHHSLNFLSSSHHHPETPHLVCTHSDPAKSSKRIILCHPASPTPLNSISAFRLYLPSTRSVISPFRPQRHACMVVPGFSEPPPLLKQKENENKTKRRARHMGVVVTRGEIPFRHLLFAGQLKLYVENNMKGPICVCIY